MELLILLVILALLIAGPVISHSFGKQQEEVTRRLCEFIFQNYEDLANGATLDYNGTPINRYSQLTRYRYCYSYIAVTSSRSSGLYLVDSLSENDEAKGAKLTCQLITALSGWWGIPWGIIYSIQFLFSNGAKNGTNDETVGDIMQRMSNAA